MGRSLVSAIICAHWKIFNILALNGQVAKVTSKDNRVNDGCLFHGKGTPKNCASFETCCLSLLTPTVQ